MRQLCRALWRDKAYSLVNILGLSLGFATFLLLFLYVRSEYAYDRHIEDHERLYRLTAEVHMNGERSLHAKVGSLVPQLLAQEEPALGQYVRLSPLSLLTSTLLFTDDLTIAWEEGIYHADNSVFALFGVEVLAGDPAQALLEPRDLALSRSAAERYFGLENPIGKTLNVQAAGNTYRVALVFEDLPANSSLKFDVLFPYDGASLSDNPDVSFENGIVWFNDYAYFRLPAGFEPNRLDVLSQRFFERHVAGPAARMFPNQDARIRYHLQPIADIRLAPAMEEDLPKGDALTLSVLAGVAVIVLLLASVNTMQISTARYTQRARPLGIRLVLGAGPGRLALGFLGEGLLLSLLALLTGISLTELLLASALDDRLVGYPLELSLFADPALLGQVGLVALFVALLSGGVPALYFASVRALDASRAAPARRSGLRLRTLLIGLQMLLSVAVIAGTLLMYRQMEWLNSQPLGFDKANKVDITVHRTASGGEFRSVVERLAAHPAIRHASMSEVFPGSLVASQPVSLAGDGGHSRMLMLDWYNVDERYLDTLGITLKEGHNFEVYTQASSEVDLQPLLVNQALVREMGWEVALGKELHFQVSDMRGRVIGVMEDFNFRSLHEPIRPLALLPLYDNYRWQRHFLLDVEPLRLSEALAHAERVLRDFAPGQPFQYRLVDRALDAFYQADRQQMQLIGAGALVCILIALLGLAGLSAYLLDQRSKEIGIRKALGASLPALFTLLFGRSFLLIVGAALLAGLLLLPLATLWLAGFAYRIEPSPWVLAQATGAVLLLAAVVVLLQLLRAAARAPVQTLRYE